ncbi:MAG: S1 RNA-binding domain-containing protein [Candidatus Staskawiczbacteria bacterium]|nr:S1 RNA-binding domain-containing protein [Candidatus Staskawiczbacteria bacterium]
MTKEIIIKKSTDSSSQLSIGATIEGKVVARDRSSLYIDLGINGTGIIYGREFYEAKEAIKNLQVGDTVFAKITELENDEGYKELSLRDATKEISWQKLEDMKKSGQIINVRVTGVNKGGLLATLDGIQAFLPVSQLAPEHYPRVADADKQKILKELQKFIGKTLEVKILDLLAEENKLILSEKAKSEEKIKETLKNYKKGDIVDGEITGIADFGAFIKFPADVEDKNDQIEGLIHISELDWQLVENPAEVVTVGETVKAKVIDINNNQVFLSLKALKPNPWEEIEKEYKKGDVIKGKITKFSAFGAFVEVAPKIRGLCHISEFASKEEMESKLKIGKSYDFEVLLIEPKEHRMSLKLVK